MNTQKTNDDGIICGVPIFNPHKFSPVEIFSNNNGKTSSTKVVGFIASCVCLFLFLILVLYYFINPGECGNILAFIDRTITYFSVSAGLMGIKSITSSFGKNRIEITEAPCIKKPVNKPEVEDENQNQSNDSADTCE
ncbi:MAG: hypothetical protein [Vetruanivirus porcinprimi]|uniref:Holin n=1 Tax=phage Lak_Megaphage_RVC_AP1_GC26 TaxID=3109224 RepID=A0ABZ0Z8B8_9CAUD|nr:MAG: hypothetical protein [phage Lak_Megaphage_RVC_AP1_GC26]